MSGSSPAQHYASAFAAFQRGQHEQALRDLQALLAVAPRHAEGWNLAGVVLNVRGEFDSAAQCFAQAAELGVGAGAWVNLGFALQRLGRMEASARAYARAVQLDAGFPLAWQKQAELQELQGRPLDALASYRRAFALAPSDLKSHGNALFLRRHLADWAEDALPTPDSLLAALALAPRTDFGPMLLLALPEADNAHVRHAAQRFAHSQYGYALAQPPLVPRATPAAGRRLRIGYASSDFREHAVSFLVSEVIAAHDRVHVEVFLYAFGPPSADRWRKAAVVAAEHFVELGPLEDRAAAERIARDGIDVLVDLNGYTQHARTGVMAWRPAPVLVSWLGYIGTLAEPRLADYVIGDAVATPLSQADEFSEAIAWLPHCFQPNARLSPLPEPPTRASEGLPADAVVFCSFNQTFKLNPALWDDWCEILRAVPGSVLWLAPPRFDEAKANLRAEARQRGVAPERLVFARHVPLESHHARLQLADIALDTYPYNSGTTASDAVRAGVPLLSFAGDRLVSRMGSSLMHALGLPECVAADRAGLVRLAVDLGLDAARRGELRARLGQRRYDSALFRPDLFARDLERLFATMHAQALEGRRDPITLPPANGGRPE